MKNTDIRFILSFLFYGKLHKINRADRARALAERLTDTAALSEIISVSSA